MMTKRTILQIYLIMWIIFASCGKDNIIPLYGEYEEGKEIVIDTLSNQPPNWRVQSPFMYPYTMSAIVVIPDSIAALYKSSDELAVFSDETCRGVAEHVNNEGFGNRWFTVIYGNEGFENLYFKYYCTEMNCFYISKNMVPFEANSRYGSVDNPNYLTFQFLK